MDVSERIENLSIPEPLTGCVLWAGAIDSGGYGRITIALAKGKIRKGLVVDHLCRNRQCINPDHLEAVTQSVNMARAHARTHCRHGHEMNDDNLYRTSTGITCLTCRRLRSKKQRKEKKAETTAHRSVVLLFA